ncbi:hypothetical protein [Psychrosphaera algicola]|uniref:Uncharacterized protein n=1 Tax=Psychrosphaera algicola TaxID=3023714 RepID=A0ABT5FBL4_9GAMM|nr:hypothetical protein [Psychrosphaera sp. G1-22]MDC2888332.1 hypothetical protein [Psychrosphaera sp. G1-22]
MANLWEALDIQRRLNFSILVFWDFGILGFWDFGILGFWDFGILGFWDFSSSNGNQCK